MPIICGTVLLKHEKDIYWVIQPLLKEQTDSVSRLKSPAETYRSAILHADSLVNRVIVSTPDKRLNVLASAANIAIDGLWYPPVFHHGALLWNLRLPGWRTIFGGTMLGWHDRVKEEAKFYFPFQIKKSKKYKAKTDPETLLTLQHNNSRFYGCGRIDKDQLFYNMQTQFFDQLITEWYWTADPELEKMLRPVLELHLKWEKECFDPDGDGVYESYLNIWSSDSEWCNGSGTAEETSYAYRGHSAAHDMAHRSGDLVAENFHNRMMKKIKKGFFSKLWIKSKGHSSAYREQGGHQRLHEDPSLYSIFLPIDAKLINKKQSVESLYYSEWALQNDRMPFGGRKVWTSNRVPGIWSVRELWPGDNYHLALAYFQTGLAIDGWDIFKGTFLHSAFDQDVPGNFGVPSGGTDFGDFSGMFCRTLVEGLFGYYPNYPDGIVTIAPQFPVDWDSASIKTPDIVFRFDRKKIKITSHIELNREAEFDIYIPVNTNNIKSVTNDNKPVKWKLLPSFGKSLLNIKLSKRKKVDLVIMVDKFLPQYNSVKLEGNVSDSIKLIANGAEIIQYTDPQVTLINSKVSKGIIYGRLAAKPGYHTIIAKVKTDNALQWRIFHIKINDMAAVSARETKSLSELPVKPNWECIDIGKILKNDIRTIYQQKYLSQRPNTVSARIGRDGYSPWTFPYWNSSPPIIKLNLVSDQLDNSGHLVTLQKVPFNWGGEQKNIAFTSLWNNFPQKVVVPVKKKGEALWFLISGSTNPMQCNIANAIVKMRYADGKEESFELIPPRNYWNLCPIRSESPAPGQEGRCDYTNEIDKFCLPKELPSTVQLGENCRAMVLNWRLRHGIELECITLETLSQEVVVGLLGLTVMNPEK